MAKAKLESAVMGDGSYGLRSKRDGGVLRVWFCGGTRQPAITLGNITRVPCAHPTQIRASECPQRPDR